MTFRGLEASVYLTAGRPSSSDVFQTLSIHLGPRIIIDFDVCEACLELDAEHGVIDILRKCLEPLTDRKCLEP